MPTLYARYDTLPVDDTDKRFQYGGTWRELEGSSRQWNAGVSVTLQAGATVSFSFVGSDAFIYHTIPSGSGNVVVDISVDGGSSVQVSRTCGSQPVYNDILYKTPIMADGIKHSVLIINRSPSTVPFMFDKVDLHAQDFATMLAPAPAAAPTTTQAQPTTTSAAPVTTTTPPSITSPTSSTTAVATQSAQSSANSSSPSSSGTQGSTSVSNSSIGSTTAQSSTTIVTTDAHGATVTQTKAIGITSVSDLPGATQTDAVGAGNSGAASKPPTAIAVILAIVFALVAAFLILVLITIFLRRRQRSREMAQLADSPERTLIARPANLAPNPFRLEPQPAGATESSEAQYVVGGAAIYRDEKRGYDHSSESSDALDSPEAHPGPSQMSHFGDRDSTAYGTAPPAYSDNRRTSLGTSFYQQSAR